VIALGGAVNASFVLGSAQFALSTFLVPMEEDLGWSRSVFFGALSVRFLLSGLLGPVVGPLADGVRAPRVIVPLGVILMSGSLVAIRWVDSPVAFFALYGVVGAFATAILHLATWEALILKWFSRKRTRALVIGGVGEASGPMFSPLLVTLFITLFGWRDAWLWYGALIFVMLMPIALAVRTRPEQMGQALDGDQAAPTAGNPAAPAEALAEARFNRRDAMGTQGFWLLLGIFTLSGVVITGFQSNWIPHFRDIGIGATPAAVAVSVYGGVNIASRMVWGALLVRFPIKRLMVVHAIAAGGGVAFLVFVVDNLLTLFIWAAYQGMVLGVFFSLHTIISAEFFGRPHIGAIRGTMMPAASLSRAGGPLLLAALREWRGTYELAFVTVLGGWAVMAVLALLARKPGRRSAS